MADGKAKGSEGIVGEDVYTLRVRRLLCCRTRASKQEGALTSPREGLWLPPEVLYVHNLGGSEGHLQRGPEVSL